MPAVLRLILGFLGTVLIAGDALAERRVAFLVGNSDYVAAPTLKNPRADVELVGAALAGVGFDVTTRFDLTRSEIAEELVQFLDREEGADLTLFYFAGHGMQFENRNYLLGTDADLRSALDVEDDGLDLQRVLALMSRKTNAALVFVDACRDNPLATNFYKSNYSATRAAATRGLARLPTAFQGTMVTFSAAPGQVAYDGDGRNSPFATALARHIPTENIELLSLTKRIIGDVRDATEGLQSPLVVNDLTREIFLREAALRPEGSAASPAPDRERLLFEAADKIATLHAWARYFENYPDGRFRGLALQREHEVLLREVAHLAADWEVSAPQVAVTDDLAARFNARLGLDRNDAMAVQALLRRTGHYSGPLDGDLGPASRAAIRDFQSAEDVPVTGILTRHTAEALGLRIPKLKDRPSFSSHRRRSLNLEAAELLGFDKRLLDWLTTAPSASMIYGYRDDRLYVATSAFGTGGILSNGEIIGKEGRYLVSINDQEENRWVYELVRFDRTFWRLGGDTTKMYFGPGIGLIQEKNAAEPRGGWRWASGETTGYRAWDRSEPNDYNGREDYAHIWMLAENWRGTPDLPQGPRWNDGVSYGNTVIVEVE